MAKFLQKDPSKVRRHGLLVLWPSHWSRPGPGTFKDLRLYKFEEDYWLSSLVC